LSTPSEFDVTVETTPSGVVILHVVGELDMATCRRVEDTMRTAVPASRVIIDLSKCSFLDSAGLRFLIAAHRDVASAGGTMELVAADSGIVRVLDLTNVDTMMTVHESLETAL
jgi:anti-anti-sigma factor